MAKQKFTPRPKESEAVITKRWTKKRDSIENLANNVQSLRYNVSLGLKNESKNEKNFLTCLVISLILKTGERVGNSASESNGHVGITGLKKDQLTIIGNKIILEYTGKSGVEHEKMFSDEKIAKALKIAKKNSPDNNIFTTSKGFKIKNVRINRFLSDFSVSAKDIRGYSSNNLLIRKLRDLEPEDTEAKRKRQFNKAARFVAKKIGHGLATMKKHYMLPELEPSFVEKSIVIDIDDVSKYNDGGAIKSGKIKVSASADKFTCKDAVPDSKLKKSLPKEVKEILKEKYHLKKGGDISLDNFHLNTEANYSSISENEIPNREPDFISESGSKYWYDGECVIRQSDHWGELGECNWLLDSESYSGLNQGICLLSNFNKKNIKMENGGAIQEFGDKLLPIGTIIYVNEFRSSHTFEVVGFIGERDGIGRQYEAYELKADMRGVKGKKTKITFPYPNTKTKFRYHVTLPKEGSKLISQSEIDSEKRRGSESEVVIKWEGDKPSYLMTKEEYKSIVTPKIKEFNKFISKNKEYFSRNEYYGFDYLDFESYSRIHKASQYSTIERDFLRGKPEDIKGAIPKQANEKLIKELNEYKDYFASIFGIENIKKVEDDEVGNNKRSVRRAIDSGVYEKLLREGKINYAFLKNVFDSVGINIPTKLEKIESEVVEKGITSDVQVSLKERTDVFFIQLNKLFEKEIRFYADTFANHYSKSIKRMKEFCDKYKEFVNYDTFAYNYSLYNNYEPTPIYESVRGIKKLKGYNYHPDIANVIFLSKIFENSSSDNNIVKYYIANNWEELLESRALDYANNLFNGFGRRILKETESINSIDKNLPEIQNATVSKLTEKGFESKFDLKYPNGFIFSVETQVIYAGGYNIQALHLRGLFKFKYKGKFVSEKEIVDAYKSFNSDEKTFEKGGLIINGISIPENIDALLKEKYSLDNDVSFHSDEWNKIIGKRGDMGLVPDEVRKSDEYIRLKTKYKLSFKKFQDFNQSDKNKTILDFTKKLDRVTQQKIRHYYLNKANRQDKMLFGGVIDGNTELFETAMSFKKLGFSDEKIFYETGYFIGLDGKWRSEIDDDSYVFLLTEKQLLEKYENKSILKLGDLVSHSEFFRILPKSKDILVNLYDLDDYDFIYFKRNPEENCIAEFNYRLDYPTKFNFYKIDLYIDFKYIKEHGEERKKYPNESSIGLCTLHEMQHVLQNQRGNRRSSTDSERRKQFSEEIERARIQLQDVSNSIGSDVSNDKYDLENYLNYLIVNQSSYLHELYYNDPAEVEARTVVQRFINKDKSFPSELNYSPEVMKNGGSVNPYAVCTTSIGKKEDTQKRSDWSEEGLDKYERCVLKVKAKMSNGGELKIEKKKVYEGDKIIRDMPLNEVEKYIGIYHEQEGNIFFAKNRFLIWFYDTADFATKINSGEYDFLMFPNRMKGFSFNSVGIIDEIWTSKWQNKFKGAKNLLGMVQGYYDEANNKIVIHFMSVRPSAKRNHINSFMIQYAKKVFNSNDVVFHEPTEQGQSFIDSNKFENGGDLSSKIKVEVDYDLLAPNGKPSNLTSEQYKLVRSPEFILWFGDWINDPENASKAVDSNGEPLVVYHTTNSSHNIFNERFAFFSKDKLNFGKRIISAFMNIRNPYTLNDADSWSNINISKRDERWEEMYNDLGNEDGIVIENVCTWAKEKGYDGVIAINIGETEDASIVTDDYISFNPTQIKLADGTNTTFDGSNPDIRFENGGSIEKLAFIQKNENGFYWLYSINDKGDYYKEVDGDKRLYVVKDMAKRWGYKLVTPNEFNDYYKIPERVRVYDKYSHEGSILLAPNGKPTNLTAEQYRLVRTPEFISWFGDWIEDPENASKVVDENGEPLVCFHGSTGFYDGKNIELENKEINQFSSERLIFTTDNIEVAKYFGDYKHYFVNIKNPFLINSGYNTWDRLDESFMIKRLGEKTFIDLINWEYKLNYKSLSDWEKQAKLDPDIISIDSLSYYLKENDNYDGVIAYKIEETTNNIESNDYIAFNPNQIKLADGTNTTFDSNNIDIRFGSGGKVSLNKNFTKWFDDNLNEFSVNNKGVPTIWYHARSSDFNTFKNNYAYFAETETYASQYGDVVKPFYVKCKKTLNLEFVKYDDAYRFESLAIWVEEQGGKKEGKDYEILKNAYSKYTKANPDKSFFLMWEFFSQYNPLAKHFVGWLKKYFDSIYYWEQGKRTKNNRSWNKGKILYVFGNDIYKRIKIADGTNTKFDSNNRDIRFEDGGITWTDYKNSQFNEEEHRYLPSDYFKPFEVERNIKNKYSFLLDTKNGIEYRLQDGRQNIVGAFDGEDLVGYSDNAAIEVSPKYQKRGIGLNLITLIKERNPKHIFGNMTPQGFRLMGSYYDKKIANTDVRFDEGGELYSEISKEINEVVALSKKDLSPMQLQYLNKKLLFFPSDKMNTLKKINENLWRELSDKKMKVKDILNKKETKEGFAGYLKEKYAYHFTTILNLTRIVESKSIGDWQKLGHVISLTTNPIFGEVEVSGVKNWNQTMDIKKAQFFSDLSVKIVFDLQKLITDGIKIRKGSGRLGTHFGEYELIIPKFNEKDKWWKYVSWIEIDNNKTEIKELFEYEWVKNRKIKDIMQLPIDTFINGKQRESTLGVELKKLGIEVREREKIDVEKYLFGDKKPRYAEGGEVFNIDSEIERKNVISNIMGSVPFRKFGNAYRKHIDENFLATMQYGSGSNDMSWKEKASYIIGDGNYSVTKEQFINFMKEFPNHKYENGGAIENDELSVLKIPFSKLKSTIQKNNYDLSFKPIINKPYIIEDVSSGYRSDIVSIIKQWFKINGDTIEKGVGLDKSLVQDEYYIYVYKYVPEYNKYLFQIIRKDESPIKCSIKDLDVKLKKVKLNDGGSISFDKVISASSRFRPTETVVFDPPLEGKNGAKLISYTWSYEWTMKPSNEGELVSKRVSDWTQAEISAETGRDIVHQYTILMPSGEHKTVSSDSVPVLLGYLDKKELKSFPNLVTASKTLAKQQMQLAILEAQKKEYDDLYAKFEKAEKPEIKEVGEDSKFSAIIESYKKGAYSNYAMGDVIYRQDNEYVYGTNDYKKTPISRTTIEQLTWAWISKRVEENGGVNPRGLYDLKNRVARQKRKVENILNSKMENGGTINENIYEHIYYKDYPKEYVDSIISLILSDKVKSDIDRIEALGNMGEFKDAHKLCLDLYKYLSEQSPLENGSWGKEHHNSIDKIRQSTASLGYVFHEGGKFIIEHDRNNKFKLLDEPIVRNWTEYIYDLKSRVNEYSGKNVFDLNELKFESGGVIVGEEMANNKFPTLEEAYDIIENEESNQGGVWIAEEDSDYSEDAKFQDKEQAMLYVKEIYDFIESISDDDFIPVYRCVSAEEVDLDPYSIGESWSIYLDSAKEFGRHLGEPLSKLKIISGYVPKENVDWKNAIRLYHLFSDSSSSESEFELPIPSNNKILNVTVSNFKDAKELPKYNENYKNGGDVDSNDDSYSGWQEEDYLSGTIVGDVMEYMAYYEVSDTFPETERFILSHEEKIILREKTQDSKDTFKPKGLWYAFGMDWFKGVAYVVPSMAGNYKYVHKLKVTDKVCSIKTIEEAVEFTDKYGVGEGHFYKRYLIDWSKVEKDYSGVEALDPVRWCRTEGVEDKLWWLYSWDAASGCIWKSDGIESVEIYDYVKQAKDFHDDLDREQQEYIKSQGDNNDAILNNGGELQKLEINNNDIRVGLNIIQKKWGGNTYKITKVLPNNTAYVKADVRGNYGGSSTAIRTFEEIKSNYIKLIKDEYGKVLGFDYKNGKFKYNEGGNINDSEIKIKVYRGIGNNVYDEENDYVIWVAEDRRVAENYSKNGNVIELEVQKPLNPFEIPFNNIYVKGSDIGDRLTSIVNERIQDDILGNVDIDEERYKKILDAIAAFVEKSGEKSELYSHKTNNKESVGYFVKALQLLGYDGLIQKESYSSESPYTTTRSKDESITYGIFKNSNPDISFKDGGKLTNPNEKDDVYKDWKELVNMSYSELKSFYDSQEGKVAGLKKSEADELGIHSGRESARWIMKMKKTKREDWTNEMWEWAKRQIGFVKRMSGSKGYLIDEKGNKTRKYLSLLIWGNDPLKK